MSWNLERERCRTPSFLTFNENRWPGHMTSDSANQSPVMSAAILFFIAAVLWTRAMQQRALSSVRMRRRGVTTRRWRAVG